MPTPEREEKEVGHNSKIFAAFFFFFYPCLCPHAKMACFSKPGSATHAALSAQSGKKNVPGSALLSAIALGVSALEREKGKEAIREAN